MPSTWFIEEKETVDDSEFNLETIQRSARRVLSSFHTINPDDRADLLQEVLLYWAEGKWKKGKTTKHVVIDLLRKYYARADQASFQERMEVKFPTHLLPIEIHHKSYYPATEHFIFLQQIARTLAPRDRACFLLRYEWQASTEELGSLFGLDPNLVSLWLERLNDQMRKQVFSS